MGNPLLPPGSLFHFRIALIVRNIFFLISGQNLPCGNFHPFTASSCCGSSFVLREDQGHHESDVLTWCKLDSSEAELLKTESRQVAMSQDAMGDLVLTSALKIIVTPVSTKSTLFQAD